MARSFSRNQLPVRAASSLSFVRISNGRWKRRLKLVLPLFGQTSGADDEAAFEIAAGDQLLDEQPRHDRLARARIIGEQEPQRLARQHRLVDGGDLVRERIDQRCVHGEHGVEQVREADPVGLGDQAEQRTVAVEAPRPPRFDDRETRLVVAIQHFVRNPAVGRAVDQRERVGAVPLRR